MGRYTDYYQLPFKRNIIPYGDLQVTGTAGRRLYLPDDLPPVLSVPTAQQGPTPRLLTMDPDGGVDVHVTNQPASSAGVGYAQVAGDTNSSWTVAFANSASRNLATMLYCPQYIFGFQYSCFFTTLALGTNNSPFVQFYLANNSGVFLMTLGGFHTDVGGGGTLGTRSVYERTVMFDPPWDGIYTLGGVHPLQIRMDSWAGSGFVGFSFWHTL